MDKIMVFIPMYNCEKQVVRVLNQFDREIIKYINEIVIINNRSTDNGEVKVKEFIDNTDLDIKITLLRNNENYGLGGTHKVAFKYAKENCYDYAIVLHGDDQGSIKDILPFLKNKEYQNYDSFLGARFIKGSKLKNYSKFRTFGNRVYNILFSMVVHRKIYDLGSGLNMYKVNSLESEYYLKFPDNLTFNCYMLLAINCYKQKIKFFPISWREDDQVSNVKMVSQAFNTFKLVLSYLFKRKRYLQSELRTKIVSDYNFETIYEKKKGSK